MRDAPRRWRPVASPSCPTPSWLCWCGWAGSFTGGQGPFNVTPAWLASAANLAGVAAAGFLVMWLVIDHRREHGRCIPCGRENPEPARAWQSLPIWAGLAILDALPYGCGMGRRLTTRWLLPVLVTVGGLGSLMLLPVGAVALVYTAQVALGSRTIDD